MIGEIIRDLVFELNRISIPDDVKFILDFQIKNLFLSAEIGKKSINYQEAYEKAKKLGFSENVISAFLNSSASIFYDWDDYLFAGHTGHSSVFVSHSLTKEVEKLMKAVLIGNEVGGRVGALCILGPLNGQMMSYIHGIISAVITEYITGEISNIPKRVSYYMSNPNFLTYEGFMGGKTKIFSSTFPIVLGMISSIFELGDNRESENGFFKLFSYSSYKSIEKNIERIFSPSFFLTRTLMIKKYPACAYVIPQIECAVSIREQIEMEKGFFDVEKVDKIKIEYSIINYILDQISLKYIPDDLSNRVPLQFSTPIAFIVALMSEDDFNPRSYYVFSRSELMRLYGKTEIKHNVGFTNKVLKNVLNHFPIPAVPDVKGIIYALSGLFGWNRPSIPKNLFEVIQTLIFSGEPKFKPDNFEFLFPTRVQVVYGGRVFEEERSSHSFLARAVSKEEMEKFLQFKNFIKSL